MKLRWLVCVLVALLGTVGLTQAGYAGDGTRPVPSAPAPAEPTADPVVADAGQLAQAMDIPAGDVISADLMGSDPAGAAVSEPLGKLFPTRGSSFAIISSGNAVDAALPDNEPNRSTALGGLK